MKTKAELEQDIVNLTMKIHKEFPELIKYINEMPDNISTKETNQITAKSFKEYFNSLQEVVDEYAKTHNVKKVKTDLEISEFPGYPHYPSSEDIYSQGKKVSEIDPTDISKRKTPNEPKGTSNEKSFEEDMSGADLDVPGTDLDDEPELIGSEDEENNYYSIGGDNHNNLDEDNG